jgi:hypothetical protein
LPLAIVPLAMDIHSRQLAIQKVEWTCVGQRHPQIAQGVMNFIHLIQVVKEQTNYMPSQRAQAQVLIKTLMKISLLAALNAPKRLQDVFNKLLNLV